jgi:hypothetical protein
MFPVMPLLSGFAPVLAALMFLVVPVIGKPAERPVVNVVAEGVVGDGKTLNTARIQKVIDACGDAGGIILFPSGKYVTGTIRIRSNVTLRLAEGAELLGSSDVADYLNLDPFIDGSGNPMGHALIVAMDASDVGIEGPGTVDGRSPELKKTQNPYLMRPFLIRFVRCAGVTVKDVSLLNPGAWTLNLFRTKGALIEGVTIRSRDLGMHNNDGIDLDSCEDIIIRNCDINSGDDALCVKATSSAMPSRNITVTGCGLSTRCNAIKLGTESIGGFENISVSGCRITNTKMAGIALYSVDGADLRNVTISDVTMDGVTVPVSIRLGARLKSFRAGDVPRTSPGRLRDVTIRNVRATNVGMIGMLVNGVPGHPVENLTLENIRLELPGGSQDGASVELPEKESAYPEYNMFGKVMPSSAIYMRHVRGVKFIDVMTTLLRPDTRPPTVLIDVENITPPDFVSADQPTKPASSSGTR